MSKKTLDKDAKNNIEVEIDFDKINKYSQYKVYNNYPTVIDKFNEC